MLSPKNMTLVAEEVDTIYQKELYTSKLDHNNQDNQLIEILKA